MVRSVKSSAASRGSFLQTLTATAFGLSALISEPTLAAQHESGHNMNAIEALDRLLQGNSRYARDMAVNCNKNFVRRAEVASAQHPFAMVLGCADSRVPPEVIFDQRLGDVFTVRVAGNVADANAIGSFEYAVLHFGSPLLMVLGHQKCGAVAATLEAVEKGTSAPGHIGSIVGAIKPAVESVRGASGDVLDAAIRSNIKSVTASLRASSSILAQRVSAGNLRLVGAYYSLSDGRVTLVD